MVVEDPGLLRSALRYVPVGLALFALQLDFFSLSLALPTIAADLVVPVTDLQWLLSGYLLSLGCLFVPSAKLGDVLGRQRVLVAGTAVFGLTSLVCGLASDPSVLVTFRILQGAGAAMIMPNAFALMGATTREEQRAKIMGLMLGLSGAGTALGPVVGGLLAASAGWRWVFFINIPVAVVALIGARRLPDSTAGASRGQLRDIDWPGAALLVLALVGISLAVDDVASDGVVGVLTWGPAVVGAVSLILFVRRAARIAKPLVDPSLLRNGSYVTIVLAATAANVGLNVYVFAATLQLQSVDRLSPATAGLIFMLASVGLAAGGPGSGWLTQRFGAVNVLIGALFLGAVSVAGVALSAHIVPVYVVALGVAGFTCGMGFSVSQIGIQALLPAARAGEGSSLALTLIVAVGGIAVVSAGGVIEALSGAPTAGSLTLLLLGLAAFLAICGLITVLAVLRRTRPAADQIRSAATPTAS